MTTQYSPSTIISGTNTFSTYEKDGKNRNASPIQDYFLYRKLGSADSQETTVVFPETDVLFTHIIVQALSATDLPNAGDITTVVYDPIAVKNYEQTLYNSQSYLTKNGILLPIHTLCKAGWQFNITLNLRTVSVNVYAIPVFINEPIIVLAP